MGKKQKSRKNRREDLLKSLKPSGSGGFTMHSNKAAMDLLSYVSDPPVHGLRQERAGQLLVVNVLKIAIRTAPLSIESNEA